jgi:hypothetical protein
MKVKTTYLRMFARPERVVAPPRDGLAVVHARKPTVAYYRTTPWGGTTTGTAARSSRMRNLPPS